MTGAMLSAQTLPARRMLMTTQPIVAATDGSTESLQAVDWAAREAVLRGAPLRIVSAASLLPRMTEEPEEHPGTVTDVLVRTRDVALATAAERAARVAPDLLIDTDRLSGAPAEAVTQSGSGALMLVVGSRGSGAFTALILGSVSRYAATHADCPVVVVRDETAATHRQVVVGVADQESCPAALAFAFEEAAVRQASLLAVHAWHMPQPEVSRAGDIFTGSDAHDVEAKAGAALAALLDDCRGKYPGVQVSQDIVHGHPGRALAGLSARADLVVIGRRPRHHGLPGVGSVTHAVLNHAHGPVATVPTV
jgi:nucleotide-binding universal stress UspA family protein